MWLARVFARRYRFPRVVDGFLVPATAEPLITCHLNGSAEFQERDIGDQCLAAFEMIYQGKASAVEVTDFFGRDETLAHLNFACAEMLSIQTAGNAKRVAAFAHLLAIYIAEKYTNVAAQRPDYRGGLTIAGSARSRTMCVRTSQKASQSRRWLS